MADESAHASSSEIFTLTFYHSGQIVPLRRKLVMVIYLFLSKDEAWWNASEGFKHPWLVNDKCEGQTNAVNLTKDGVVM